MPRKKTEFNPPKELIKEAAAIAKTAPEIKTSKRGRIGEGRPTKYRPEYCDLLIKHFSIEPYRVEKRVKIDKNGTVIPYEELVPNPPPHVVTFYTLIGISEETFYAWVDAIPEFSEAYKTAQRYLERIYETNAAVNLYNPSWSIFAAKNRFHDRDWKKWTDKQEIDHTSKGDKLNQPAPTFDWSKLTTAELEIMAAIQKKAQVDAGQNTGE